MGPAMVVATSPHEIGSQEGTYAYLRTYTYLKKRSMGPLTGVSKDLIDPYKLEDHIEKKDVPHDFNIILFDNPRLPMWHDHYWARWKHYMALEVKAAYLEYFIVECTHILKQKKQTGDEI